MANSQTKSLTTISLFQLIKQQLPKMVFAALISMACVITSTCANANEVLRIRAIVNDDVISFYDLFQRVRLLIMTSAIPDTPDNRKRLAPQVLRAMIDEKLRLQEAARLNIRVPTSRVNQQISLLEERNNLPSGSIPRLLDQASIGHSVLHDKLRGEIAWQSIVRRRLIKQVNVSNEEIEDEFRRLQSIQHLPKYKVSEIFLAVDNPDQEDQVLDVARRLLGQLDEGAKFNLIAREFSQSSSAATGGNLGTVSKGQLDPKLEKALDALDNGGLAGPLRTLSGFYILKLHERISPTIHKNEPVMAFVSQLLLPLKPEAKKAEIDSQEDIAAQIRDTSTSCKHLDESGRALNTPQSGSLGKINIEELPLTISTAIRNLPANKVSPTIRVAEGLLLMMVCEWDKPMSRLPPKKEVRARLGDRQLNLLMQRYMRDLRRTAYIDLRG